MPDRTLCLCCGEHYGPEDAFCANVSDGRHSLGHAATVAAALLSRGINHPTAAEVRWAVEYVADRRRLD